MADSAVQSREEDSQASTAGSTPAQGTGKGGASTKGARYRVSAVETAPVPAPAEKAAAAARAPGKKVAVFVAHGMGQQIPFQTLDQVAEGLLRQDVKTGIKPEVRAVKFKDQWLQRIELKLRQGDANPVEAHIYEAYWAPLTEGKIAASGVLGFLRGAGLNGIRNGSQAFYRWLFGNYWRFDSPIRIVLYLLIALLTLSSLAAMNSTIALVAAARALLGKTPSWLSDGLFADLTTTFNGVIVGMALFGMSLGIAYGLRRLRAPAGVRLIWGWLTVVLFVALLFMIVLAGLSLAFLFYGHVKLQTADADQIWYRLFPRASVDGFNNGFDTWAWRLAILCGSLYLAWWVFRIFWGVVRDLLSSPGRWLTIFVTICIVALGFLAIRLGLAFWGVLRSGDGNGALSVVRSGLAWPLLVVVSAFVRRVLVQYVGDVAIYVAPYKLDAFFQLREQIRDCVYKTASAVYALQREDGSGPEYDQVLVVGHSLGSVIVYDALNRLVNEDEAAGRPASIVNRTPLLLTFGSPLDKTAFLFGIQRQNTDEAREALAASVQPLIRGYEFRPESWINIHSPWDIISGSLGFYDPPGSYDPKRVINEVDPDATTLLAAHVEYWSNPKLFQKLYQAL